ncbi:MAG TPA: hypothetical protein EYH06_01945 [Chromatiales bacterium]|nr:hypothetical protein [Chromatiales bacterium]
MSTATKKRTKENAAHCGFYFLLTVSTLIGTVSTGLPAMAKLTLPSMAMCSGALTANRKAAKGGRKARFFQASGFIHPLSVAPLL